MMLQKFVKGVEDHIMLTIVSGGHEILLPFIWTVLGQVRNFTTYLTTTTLTNILI